MYNEITKECSCNRCGKTWRARGDSAPAVCPKCTSRLWNDGSRKFEVIIARVCGPDPERNDMQKFCILEYADRPGIESEDVFYLSQEDLNRFFWGKRYTAGSALVFVGDFELGESLELVINECKLIFYIEAGFREYTSNVKCLYSIKSYYERLKAQKLREEEKERLALLEEERKQKLLEEARARIEADAARLKAIEEAKAKIADETATTEERLRAVRLLEHAA